jgi:hypothetical protein
MKFPHFQYYGSEVDPNFKKNGSVDWILIRNQEENNDILLSISLFGHEQPAPRPKSGYATQASRLNKLKNISFHLSISEGVNLFDAMALIKQKGDRDPEGQNRITHARTIQIRTQTSCKNTGYN